MKTLLDNKNVEIVFGDGIPQIKLKHPLEELIEENEKIISKYIWYKKIGYVLVGMIGGMLFSLFIIFLLAFLLL